MKCKKRTEIFKLFNIIEKFEGGLANHHTFLHFFCETFPKQKKLSFGGEKGLPDVCQISLGHIRNQIFCNLMEPKDLLRLFTNPNHTISYNTSLSCPILLRFSVCLSHKRKVEFGQKLPCTLCDTISVNIYVPGVDM